MVKQFWILEIKQLADGSYEHEVRWAFDADPDTALVKAKAVFHGIFSAEAELNLRQHTAVIIDAEGNLIDRECIVHSTYSTAPEEAEEPTE